MGRTEKNSKEALALPLACRKVQGLDSAAGQLGEEDELIDLRVDPERHQDGTRRARTPQEECSTLSLTEILEEYIG